MVFFFGRSILQHVPSFSIFLIVRSAFVYGEAGGSPPNTSQVSLGGEHVIEHHWTSTFDGDVCALLNGILCKPSRLRAVWPCTNLLKARVRVNACLDLCFPCRFNAIPNRCPQFTMLVLGNITSSVRCWKSARTFREKLRYQSF